MTTLRRCRCRRAHVSSFCSRQWRRLCRNRLILLQLQSTLRPACGPVALITFVGKPPAAATQHKAEEERETFDSVTLVSDAFLVAAAAAAAGR